MLPFIITAHLALLAISIASQTSYYQYIIAPIINSIMLCIIIFRFDLKYAMHRFSCGEILPFYLYNIWLYLFPQPELLYVLPLFLSCSGKTYLMVTPANELQVDTVQSIIILQSKVQMVILIHHFLKVVFLGFPFKIIELALLILLFKHKYTIHYGTRKGLSELHFGLDRLAKGFGMRGTYHSMHKVICLLGSGIWKDSKQITY